MTISFEQEYPKNLGIEYETVAKKVIEAAIDYEKCPYESEVSLTLTDNPGIHEINNEFRYMDRSTDVLSFPLVEYNKPAVFDFLEENNDCFNPETGELVLGDIVISLDKVESQAEEFGHSVLREYAFLIAHSMLHLMGYDHTCKEDTIIMEEHQEAILQSINITRDEK